MIGIKVNGRFLDLKPDTTGEKERKSPFFGIEDSISEVSTSLTFPYTPNNAIALNLPFQYYTERKKIKTDAEQYDGNSYRGKCTLVLETGKLNLNNIEATEITGYVLYGISDFYQQVKDKKLSDLALGGVRTFNYTTNLPFDGTGGFWQHIHASWTDKTIPYVFQPIRNEAYYGENADVDWMNKLNDQATLLYDFRFPLVPMIRLKFLIEQIFSEVGFTVDFFGLNDSDWEKLLLLNLTKVDWLTTGPASVNGSIVIQPNPSTVIQIDLKRHVPQEKLISDFIVQLFNRYGWAPLFDPMSRVCRLVSVKEADSGPLKDWTAYADPSIESNFNQDEKSWSFTNDIDSNDALPSSPDLTNLKIGLPVVSVNLLPVPTSADADLVRFCYHENQWWQVQLDSITNKFAWAFFADNIYNEEEQGATDTVATTISTLPCYLTNFKTDSLAYSGVFPAMKQECTKNIGYRTVLYHGMVHVLGYNGYVSGPFILPNLYYPHASSTREDADGTHPLTWSNVYVHDYMGGTNAAVSYGIIEYWWKKFLAVLQAGEEVVMNINVPLHELLKFRWDDRILIRNMAFLVKSFVEPMPYTGYIQATMKRLRKAPVPVVAIVGGVATGVYARLVANPVGTQTNGPLVGYYCDIVVLLFSDASGTIPYTPPATLYVYVQEENINKNNGTVTTMTDNYQYYAATGPVTIIKSNTIVKLTYGTSEGEIIYSLDPSGANGYQVI